MVELVCTKCGYKKKFSTIRSMKQSHVRGWLRTRGKEGEALVLCPICANQPRRRSPEMSYLNLGDIFEQEQWESNFGLQEEILS